MIPTIETIVEDLLAGSITKQQALAWLFMHAEGSANELRDYFAAKATDEDIAEHGQHLLGKYQNWREVARYRHADAMLKARGQ